MSISSRSDFGGNTTNKKYYVSSFIKRSHMIIKYGYDQIVPSGYGSSDEEDITGDLTRGMNEAIELPSAPSWCKYFIVSEEVRVHSASLKGKHRKRVDIEIIKSQYGRRPRLRFEAKRLRTNSDINTYLGRSGLGCFVHEDYAVDDDVVGMIGYVQKGEVAVHANAIENMMLNDPDKYHCRDGAIWTSHNLANGMDTYLSKHCRISLSSFDVLHTLLLFC